MKSAKSRDREYALTYFQPGQLSFFVTHKGLLKPPQQAIEQLLKESSKVLRKRRDGAELIPGPALHFPAVPGEDQPSKKVYYSKLQEDNPRKPTITTRPESSVLYYHVTRVDDDPLEFFKFVIQLEEELRVRSFDRVMLRAVSPNWLMSGAPGDAGTGGPGSWPAPYRGAPDHAPYQFPDLPDDVKKSNHGQGVDVYILDTVPEQRDLEVAYAEWQDRHPLIHSLLRPDGPLREPNGQWRILRTPVNDSRRIANLRARGHDYKMTDHGLFAAGLIHTIAPCANIYFIEALNPYGVGDVASVASGLEQAIQLIDKNGRPAIVNCSLTFNLPIDTKGLHNYTRQKWEDCFVDLYTDGDRALEKAIQKHIKLDKSWLEGQRLQLEHPCESIFARDSQVIAAAGNDWRSELGEGRPQARYPAAFPSVQGVGALPRDRRQTSNGKRQAASYSNQADQPDFVGVTTLGGEAGEGNGVLGIYLGEFPSGEANCTKWAWWAGTSFATPIVSGVVAATQTSLAAAQATRPTATPSTTPVPTRAAIDYLESENIFQPGQTDADEDVLDVSQGHLPS